MQRGRKNPKKLIQFSSPVSVALKLNIYSIWKSLRWNMSVIISIWTHTWVIKQNAQKKTPVSWAMLVMKVMKMMVMKSKARRWARLKGDAGCCASSYTGRHVRHMRHHPSPRAISSAPALCKDDLY